LKNINSIINGDCITVLKTLPDNSIDCCVTSPPYFNLRNYGVDGQIGLEETPKAYVAKMVEVFLEVKRVLKPEGTLWLNLGDSYASNVSAGTKVFGNPEFNKNRPSREATKTAEKKVPEGLKPKDLIGIPWRVAFALQDDGWWLRSDIIWQKPNPMPESVTDRPTRSHEYIFLMTKSERYYYDANAIKEPIKEASLKRLNQDIENQQGSSRANGGAKTNGTMKAVMFGGNKKNGGRTYSGNPWAVKEKMANKRDVWTVATKPFTEAHFATYPEELIEPCILAGCPENGIVLDPFMGAGTTALVAWKNNRNYLGIELNKEYIKIADKRLRMATSQMKIEVV
jgi:DNA modification methylase